MSVREKLISLGTYPDTSLRLAREKRDEARRRLAAGIDPSAERQAAKLAAADTFEAIGREWLEVQKPKLSAATLAKAEWMLTTFVFPHIGSRPIGEIAAPDVLRLLRRIEARGKHETAHRTRQRCSQIFRFAVASGRARGDVTVDLLGALAAVKTESLAAIVEPARIGELLRAIERPRHHRRSAAPDRRRSLLFPSLRTPARCMSENAITAALRRLGYSGEEMTWHGFRAIRRG